MSIVSRYYNILKYGFRNKFLTQFTSYRNFPYNERDISRVMSFIRQVNSDVVFVFVSLRYLKHSLGITDPYSFILNLLTREFESIIVPTFTPSVRHTGIFNVKTTPSEVGAFSKNVMQTADYRTPSPLKSYAIIGPIADKMISLQFENDYGSHGSYEFLVKNKISVINIGTIEPRFSCIHFAEYLSKVPYCSLIKRQIEVTDHLGNSTKSVYADLKHNFKYKINSQKIEKDLVKNGLMLKIRINDLILRILPDQSYFDFLMSQCKKNPYYLID